MSRVRAMLLLGSLGVGLVIVIAAPAAWGVAPAHGVLFGVALYAGALRRYAARSEARNGLGGGVRAGGILLRAAAFLALAGAQAYVFFEAAPGAELRPAFVILSSWIVLESVGNTAAGRC